MPARTMNRKEASERSKHLRDNLKQNTPQQYLSKLNPTGADDGTVDRVKERAVLADIGQALKILQSLGFVLIGGVGFGVMHHLAIVIISQYLHVVVESCESLKGRHKLFEKVYEVVEKTKETVLMLTCTTPKIFRTFATDPVETINELIMKVSSAHISA
ncbi:unnamed protein product [Caenorhabditis sp. 36 PRJEB53466]|nr:unnamed protein product [Caenorhabditis sp. 36 PRJEB53466]